jgi:hypothetical protein
MNVSYRGFKIVIVFRIFLSPLMYHFCQAGYYYINESKRFVKFECERHILL